MGQCYDVVLIHASGAVLFKGESEDHVQPNGLMTLVAAKRDSTWELVSFNNTPTGKLRNIKFLWRYLVSRIALFRAEVLKARKYMLEEKRRNMAVWHKKGTKQ